MNKKALGGIAAGIIIAVIITGILFSDNLQSIPDISPSDNVSQITQHQKIGLVVNTPSSQTTIPDLKDAYSIASSAGIGRSNVYMFWHVLEPQRDQFEWKNYDVLMSMNKQNNLKVTLYLSVINGDSLGPFPDWMGRQSLTESLAENTIRVLDVVLTRYDIVDTVILGGEINSHLRNNPGGVANYEHFFGLVYDKIKEKHPDVKIGNTFALQQVISRAEGDLVQKLSFGDFIGFNYFPVDNVNEISDTPREARTSMDSVLDIIPEKKIGFFELSWSTSDFIGGNTADQSEFIKSAFDFYSTNESQIEFFTFARQHDRPEGTCISSQIDVIEGDGFEANQFKVERLDKFVCNSGLIDTEQNPKPAWHELENQINNLK